MRRRALIAAAGATLVPRVAIRAQQAAPRRLGVMMTTRETDSLGRTRVAALLKALRDAGWQPDGNLKVDVRWFGGDAKLMREQARELLGLKPDVVLGSSTPAVGTLRDMAGGTPIVFVHVSDPIGSGFAATLARPGANITGFIDIESSLGGKWIGLLKEIAPAVTRAGLLFHPRTAAYARYYLEPFAAAARSLAIESQEASVTDVAQVEATIARLAREPGGGLVVMPTSFTGTNRGAIIDLAARYRLPTMYPYRFFTADGGLASYGIDSVDLYRRAAGYVDRILRGARIADLPIQQPTRFELTINLGTARKLGLAIAPSLLARADEVIE